MKDYKALCHDIYYASDVVDKSLTFGCEIRTKYNPILNIEISNWPAFFAFRSILDGRILFINPSDCSTLIEEEKNIKIIGHPPTLASWLRLIEMSVDEVYISGRGELVIVEYGEEKIVTNFNLTTQEPTDWEALYTLIAEKKKVLGKK